MKPSLSYKVMAKDKIYLFEKEESVKTKLETAEVLNKFFFNNFNLS